MAFVPQIAFFLAHLLFGLVVGIVLAITFRRPAVARALPAGR
jgi:multisubunit Na+/H+ antiporter MnhE subunit